MYGLIVSGLELYDRLHVLTLISDLILVCSPVFPGVGHVKIRIKIEHEVGLEVGGHSACVVFGIPDNLPLFRDDLDHIALAIGIDQQTGSL